jgi:acetyl-CoA carboxylase / biotin carboxylase 1
MKAKGVIRKQVNWAESRMFFFYRLKRRLEEFSAMNAINDSLDGNHKMSRRTISMLLQEWFIAQGNDIDAWDNDRFVCQWYADHSVELHSFIDTKRAEKQALVIRDHIQGVLSNQNIEVLSRTLSVLSAEEKAVLFKALNN